MQIHAQEMACDTWWKCSVVEDRSQKNKTSTVLQKTALNLPNKYKNLTCILIDLPKREVGEISLPASEPFARPHLEKWVRLWSFIFKRSETWASTQK